MAITSGATSGLYVDSDLVSGGVFEEVRYDRITGTFDGSWGKTSVGSSSQELTVEIEIADIAGGFTDFNATISGTGIAATTESFSLVGSSFVFGPVAFGANGTNVKLDDFTFTAAAVPEPTSFLMFGAVLGVVGFRRRRSSRQ